MPNQQNFELCDRNFKLSYMQSSEWFPLPEVSLNEEKPWWKDTSYKTTYQAANTSHSSESNFDVTEKSTTPINQTRLTPQSTVAVCEEPSIADLTITSLMTISPPRQSPSKQHGFVSSNDEYTNNNSQPTVQLPHYPHTRSGPTAPKAPKKHTQAIFLNPSQNKSSPSSHSASLHTESSPSTSHHQSTPTSQAYPTFSTSPYYATPSSITTNNETAAGTDVSLIQQASLLELDRLWRKFLASSLLNNNKENRPNLKSKSRCTCGALRKVPQTTTITEDFARTKKGTSKSKKTKRSPTTSNSSLVSDTSSVGYTPVYSHTPKRIDRSVQTSHIMQDPPHVNKPPVSFTIPVTQTTPLESKSKPSTRKPPTAFTVPFIRSSHQQLPEVIPTKTGSISLTTLVTTPHCVHLQPHQSTPVSPKVLSLSEMFALNHPEFIVHSQRREKRVRQMSEIRRKKEKTRPVILGCEETCRRGHVYPHHNPIVKHVPSRYPLVGAGTRPKVSHRKMYLNTKKAWERLPEVRKKVEEEKKQSQAATNRLRVKLYQKEVLTRLRERSKQH